MTRILILGANSQSARHTTSCQTGVIADAAHAIQSGREWLNCNETRGTIT